MVNKSREGRDGGFETSDVLITVLTSAALPVASRILTLAFGDNSLWSVDRLFIIYFASFSGWILRSYLQLVVERNGMRDKGYTFMDSGASGNAVWTFPRCSFSILLESNTRLNLTSCYLLCRSFSALEVSECLSH